MTVQFDWESSTTTTYRHPTHSPPIFHNHEDDNDTDNDEEDEDLVQEEEEVEEDNDDNEEEDMDIEEENETRPTLLPAAEDYHKDVSEDKDNRVERMPPDDDDDEEEEDDDDGEDNDDGDEHSSVVAAAMVMEDDDEGIDSSDDEEEEETGAATTIIAAEEEEDDEEEEAEVEEETAIILPSRRPHSASSKATTASTTGTEIANHNKSNVQKKTTQKRRPSSFLASSLSSLEAATTATPPTSQGSRKSHVDTQHHGPSKKKKPKQAVSNEHNNNHSKRGSQNLNSSQTKKKIPHNSHPTNAKNNNNRNNNNNNNNAVAARVVSPQCLAAARDARAQLHELVPTLPVAIADLQVRSFGRLLVPHPTDDTSTRSQPKERNGSSSNSHKHSKSKSHPNSSFLSNYATVGALHPIGFSCDRYEFSPVHGRILKMRCSILDGRAVARSRRRNRNLVKRNNTNNKHASSRTQIVEESDDDYDGPLFRIMWGRAIDEDSDSIEYRYVPQLHSAPLYDHASINSGNSNHNEKNAYAAEEEHDDDEYGAASAARASPPTVGMRVRVRFDEKRWYNGTIIEAVPNKSKSGGSNNNNNNSSSKGLSSFMDSNPPPLAAAAKKKKKKTQPPQKTCEPYMVTIKYDDDGGTEEIEYPDPDVSLLLPMVEDDVDSNGQVELTCVNGKPVTSVVGRSPIEAWGRVLVKLGLMDEIMLETALDQLHKSRRGAFQEAKKRLEQQGGSTSTTTTSTATFSNHHTLPPSSSASSIVAAQTVLSTPKSITDQDEAASAMSSAGDCHTHANGDQSPPSPAGVTASTSDESANGDVDGDGGCDEANRLLPPEDILSGSHHEEETLSEAPSEREKAYRAMVEDKLKELEEALEEDREAAVELANTRVSLQGPLLCNPFYSDSHANTQQLSWLATAVRKEKMKMGNMGNRKKIVTALDLLERNDTLYNADVEALIEGLPGSEYCSAYVFQAYRGGNTPMNRQWMHEAQLKREKELMIRKKNQREADEKFLRENENLKKRKERDDVRDQRKRQKIEEEDQKKRARIDERLLRLKAQVDERLHTEGAFQREKVISVLARGHTKEFIRRRRAAEIVAAQTVLDAKRVVHTETRELSLLPAISKTYDEDAIRVWNFMSTFEPFFVERGYVSEVPTLDSLQRAIDTIQNSTDVSILSISRSEAVATLTNIAIAMCKPLAVSLTRFLFASLIALNPALQKDFGAAFFNEMNATGGAKDVSDDSLARPDFLLPVNSMTWQEIARVSMLSDALMELGYQRHEVAHALRGYRSAGHPSSKEAKRLRKVEDFSVALARQEVAIRRVDSMAQVQRFRLVIEVPCQPLCSHKDFRFFLHYINSLPDPTVQDMKFNMAAAMKIVHSSDNTKAEEIKTELRRFMTLLDEHASTREPQIPLQLKNTYRLIFDKYADPLSDQNTNDESDIARWPWLVQRKQPTDLEIDDQFLPRERIGFLHFVQITQTLYKMLSHRRELYMEKAIRWKEEEQHKSAKDEDEDEEDDEIEDDIRNSPVTQTVNEGSACLTETVKPKLIGKSTAFDDFAGDILTAPEAIRRCLAVLRTLCSTPQAAGFLNPVDPQSNPGYYDTILQPLCLREIGNQLMEAAEKAALHPADTTSIVEQAVLQFGRNVRMIELNTVCYGSSGPTVVSMISELIRIFERLFFDWVLAPEQHLTDLTLLDDEKCVDHHPSDEEATVLFCDGCEGKFNIERLNPPLAEVPQGDWYCPRCVSGRWWGHLDPRIGKSISKVSKSVPKRGIIEKCLVRCAERPTVKASLMYTIRLDDGATQTLTLDEVDAALIDSGVGIPPIKCLEAVAESPGYGNGVDVGFRKEIIPTQSNPCVTESAAQTFLSSSVFRDTMSSASTLMVIEPENMTATEWLRLLVVLTMKCSSCDVIQAVMSKMEAAAAESMATLVGNRSKVSNIREILPDIAVEDDEDDCAELSNTTDHNQSQDAAINVNEQVVPCQEIVLSNSEMNESLPNGFHNTIAVEAQAVEVFDEMEVDPDPVEPSIVLSSIDEIHLSDNPLASIVIDDPPFFTEALLEKKRRRKIIEDSFVAHSIKTLLHPVVSSFVEDRVSQVVDATLNTSVEGLIFDNMHCGQRSCSLCGLTDVALGAPLVRMPSESEWMDLMPHAMRFRKIFLVAAMPIISNGGVVSHTFRNVALKIRVDGALFSMKFPELELLPDGGMLEFTPAAFVGFQEDLHFRHHSQLPFITGSLVAHECCAIAAHNARKEVLISRHKEHMGDLVEKEAGLRCGRSLEIGRDAQKRTYWKFLRDDASLFVCEDGASSSCWHRFQGAARVASVLCALTSEPIVMDLKRMFPEAANMLVDGSWKSSLMSMKYAKAIQFAKMGDAVEESLVEPVRVLGGLNPFAVGDEVLVESINRNLLWDATISRVSKRQLVIGSSEGAVIDAYRVQYKGWNSRFMEWVEPKRVIQPNENNRQLQNDLDGNKATAHGGLPFELNALAAKAYFHARDRVRGSLPLPDFTRIMAQVHNNGVCGGGVGGVGVVPSTSATTLTLMKVALLAIEAALPVGSVDDREKGPWNRSCARQWQYMVEHAAGPGRLMQCTILLEDLMGDEWIQEDVAHLRACLPARWKAVLESSPSSLALRILLLDRSIRYGTVDRKRYVKSTSKRKK